MTGVNEGFVSGLPLPAGYRQRVTGPVPAAEVARARELLRTRALPARQLTGGEIGNEARAAGTTAERRAELAAEAEVRRAHGYAGDQVSPEALERIIARVAGERAARALPGEPA